MNRKGKVTTFVEHTNTYIICLMLINIQKEKGRGLGNARSRGEWGFFLGRKIREDMSENLRR